MKKLAFLISISLLILPNITVLAGPTTIFVTPPSPQFSDSERQAELARRRSAVAAKMADNSILVLFSAEKKLYAHDVDYVYRQENNVYYLTNLKQANATLVMQKKGGAVTETLYIPVRNPQAETWNGRMYSNEEASAISGIKEVLPAGKAAEFLQTVKENKLNGTSIIYLLLPVNDTDIDGKREYRVENEFSKTLGSSVKVENARTIFDPLRQVKSDYEIRMLQHAVDISTEAHMRSMAVAGRAKMEYEVQAEVEYTFRRRNADFWGYPSIVGCGANATTLHYEESQGPVTKGDLLLMDVGAEYDHMSADVTRTFPVSGKFTKEQADIYRIVYNAQEAAAKFAKPGSTLDQMSDAADDVIRQGLFKLGLVTDPKSQQFRIWYMHGLGHWIGMNVHDVGADSVPLQAGMTFTNEPGIYIRADALDYLPNTAEWNNFKSKVKPAFERYKNIGVRIEDDMLITPTGFRWMTANLPRKLEDIEAFMAVAPKQVPVSEILKPKYFDTYAVR